MLFLLPVANTNLIIIFPLKVFSSNRLYDARKQKIFLRSRGKQKKKETAGS